MTSLLRTPCAAEAEGGPLSPAMASERNQTLRLTGQMIDMVNPSQLPQPGDDVKLLQTPCAAEAEGGPRNPDLGHQMRLSDQVREEQGRGNMKLLPTPEAKLAAAGPDHARVNRVGSGGHDLTTAMDILDKAQVEALPDKVLLPTPTRQDGSNDGGPSQFNRHKLPLNTQIKVLERPPGAQVATATDDGVLFAILDQEPVTTLLPTPTCPAPHDTDNTAGKLRERRDGYGAELTTMFQVGTGELLPTPKASDGDKGGPNQRGSSGDYALPAVANLLPTPAAMDGSGGRISKEKGGVRESGAKRSITLATAIHHDLTPGDPLLPTPCANDSGNTPEEHLAKKPGRTQVTSLQIIADHGLIETGGKLLPTPLAGDAKMTRNSTANRTSEPPTGIHAGDTLTDALVPQGDTPAQVMPLLPTPVTSDGVDRDIDNQLATRNSPGIDAMVHHTNWGAFEPAIKRWERILGRTAPAPTEPTGKNGNHRLNPRFVEWMMGLDKGHVTTVPGLKRNQQLKALGNGVVPQQGAYAIRHLLGRHWLYTKVDAAREAA